MIKVHYNPAEIYGDEALAENEWLEDDGVHTAGFRRVYVTVDGDFAGTMSFSTEGDKDGGYAMCYGQKDQILGVPEAGETAAAEFIASRYRKRFGSR
ncbi:hypothetical protein I5E68_09690 [Novosphingobium sp. YJ-S2-02]|uniref:Uncharacterized protein n=1 Tax=Novosphingobium aureum TaxID=2792964 RepID=A0A931HBY8_9SPHN|nr:hypothetical protein [Novosphingobium aureum]MBH0113217.1 hypothetical protein [Novosphingobium aureum]